MRRFAFFLMTFTVAVSLSFGADPQLLAKVPAQADAVMGVDVRAVLNSGVGKELMSTAKTQAQDMDEFIALTGLDPRRDVNEILVATFPVKGEAPKASSAGGPPVKTNALVLMSGTFEPAKISAALAANGAKKSMYQGREIWTPNVKTNRDGDVVSFLSNSLVVAGNPARVKQVIAGNAGALDAGLQRRVTDVSSRFDVWMVSSTSPAKIAGAVDAPGAAGEATGALQGDMFQKIESAQGGVKFGPTINVAMELNSATAEDATALMNVLQFFRSMVQGRGSSNADAGAMQNMAKMLNSIQMKTQANTLMLRMDLAETDVIEFLRTSVKRAAEKQAEPKQEEIVIIQ